MALNALGRIEVVFQFKDRSGPGIKKAKGNVGGLKDKVVKDGAAMNQAFMGAFPAIMAVGLMKQIAHGIVAILAPSIELQTSLRELKAFAGLTDEKFVAFNKTGLKTFETLSLITGKPVPELISGLTELKKKGLDFESAMAAMIPTTLAAAVGHISVADSAEAATVMFHTFGVEGQELEHRMNQLAFAAANSAIGFNELPDLMQRIGQGVAVANPLFEELIFQLVTMRNIAPGAATSATQVRRALVKLGENRVEIGAILGVDTLTTEGNLRGLSDMMAEVAGRGDNLDVIMTKLGKQFGAKAAAPLAAMKLKLDQLSDKGFEGDALVEQFLKFKNDLRGAGDEITKIFEVMAKDNPQLMIDRLGVAFEQLAAAGGGALLGTALDLVDSLTQLLVIAKNQVDSFNEWRESLVSMFPVLGVLGGFVGKMLATFGVMIGVLAVSRAGYMLFGTAVQFAVKPMVAANAVIVSTTNNLANNAIVSQRASFGVKVLAGVWDQATMAMWRGVTAMNAVAGGGARAAGGVTLLARSVKFLTSTMGMVGLVVGVLTLVMSLFGGFDADLGQLNSAVMATGGPAVEGMRAAAGDFSGTVLQAAKRFEDMFKEAPTALDTKTIGGLDEMAEAFLSRLEPKQAAKLKDGLMGDVKGAQSEFAKIKAAALAGEEISTTSAHKLATNLDNLALRFQEMGIATGDKKFTDMAKELAGNSKGLRTFNESTEDRVTTLDVMAGGEFAVQGDAAKSQNAAQARVDETIQNQQLLSKRDALMQRIRDKAIANAQANETVILGRRFNRAGAAEVEEETNKILQGNPELEKELKQLTKAVARMIIKMDSGLAVTFVGGTSDLANAVNAGVEADRSLEIEGLE